MSIAKAEKAITNKEQPGHLAALGRTLEQNPLKSHKLTQWFNRNAIQANNKYTATFDEKKQLLELQELFTKFDFDGSGTLDLDELVSMFQMAGLRIQSQKLKEMFYLAKGVKIVKNEVDLEQFQKLMLSPELDQAFRTLLKEIRRRFKYNDFSMVDPEVGYLPSDLSLMLGYLYKRSIRKNLSDQILTDKMKSTQNIAAGELVDKLGDDYNRFVSLFHLHDDASYDKELRQKYRIAPLERKFRKDQNPAKREELIRLRAITTFFLNRIKEKAVSNSSANKLVEKSLLQSTIPQVTNDRQMKMMGSEERIEVSIENLHKIQEEKRKALEKQKQQPSNSQMEEIMQGLTLTKSNSLLLEDPVVQSKSSKIELDFDAPADLSTIRNKEERQLMELLQSLNENLCMLDEVREVFERAGEDEEEQSELAIKEHERHRSDAAEEARTILEGIPTPKKIAKGKAVFSIIPDTKAQAPEDEKPGQQSGAKEKGDGKNSYEVNLRDENGFDPSTGGWEARRVKHDSGDDQMLKRRKLPPPRNATSLVHRSYMRQSNAGVSPLSGSNVRHSAEGSASGSQKLRNNALLGRSALNKRSNFLNNSSNPFRDQLELDSKELMVELLERNRHHNLTDFQRQTLRNLKNQSKRSKMIVFGDCVNQFEHMLNRRSQLYDSMQGFKKVKLEQEKDKEQEEAAPNDGQEQSNAAAELPRAQIEVTLMLNENVVSVQEQQDQPEELKTYITSDRDISQALELLDGKSSATSTKIKSSKKKAASPSSKDKTAVKNDSLFSLHRFELSKQQLSSIKQADSSRHKDMASSVNRDLDRELPGGFKQASLSSLAPLKANQRHQIQAQNHQKNLLLLSQKMKMFASPKAQKRDRTMKKQMIASEMPSGLKKKNAGTNNIYNDSNHHIGYSVSELLDTTTVGQETSTASQAALRTTSHYILPAIVNQQSSNHTTIDRRAMQQQYHYILQQNSEEQTSQNNLAAMSSHVAETQKYHQNLGLVSSNLQSQAFAKDGHEGQPNLDAAMILMSQQLESEPDINNFQTTSEPRFRKRNFGEGKFQTKNVTAGSNSLQSLSLFGQRVNSKKRHQIGSTSMKHMTQTNSVEDQQVDYNYGGYVSRLTTKNERKEILPSFFNSHQNQQVDQSSNMIIKQQSTHQSSSQPPKQKDDSSSRSPKRQSQKITNKLASNVFISTDKASESGAKKQKGHHRSRAEKTKVLSSDKSKHSSTKEDGSEPRRRDKMQKRSNKNSTALGDNTSGTEAVVTSRDELGQSTKLFKQKDQNETLSVYDSAIAQRKSRQKIFSQVSDSSQKDLLKLDEQNNRHDETLSIDKKTRRKKKQAANKKTISKNTSKKEIELSSNNSVTKIVPPQVVLDFQGVQNKHQRQDRGYGVANFIDSQPIKQQAFPSLGASSLNRTSDVNSSGFPTLAAAQARQMTRKQNIMAANSHIAKQEKGKRISQMQDKNKSGILGIVGDSLQPHMQDSSYIPKDPVHNRSKKRLVEANLEQQQDLQQDMTLQVQKMASSGATNNFTTGTEQTTRMDPNYAYVPTNTQDERISIQRSLRGNSLMETSSLNQERERPNAHESLVSSSSGNPQPNSVLNMTMNEQRPMYSGEIQTREAPQSSLNLFQQAAAENLNLVNQQDYNTLQSIQVVGATGADNDRGDTLYRTPMTDTPQQDVYQNIAQMSQMEVSYFTNMTHKSNRTINTSKALVNPGSSESIHRHQQHVTDYGAAASGSNFAKEKTATGKAVLMTDANGKKSTFMAAKGTTATPFQQFQERMKKLQVMPRDASMPSRTYLVEGDSGSGELNSLQQSNTPIFKKGAASSSNSQANTKFHQTQHGNSSKHKNQPMTKQSFNNSMNNSQYAMNNLHQSQAQPMQGMVLQGKLAGGQNNKHQQQHHSRDKKPQLVATETSAQTQNNAMLYKQLKPKQQPNVAAVAAAGDAGQSMTVTQQPSITGSNSSNHQINKKRRMSDEQIANSLQASSMLSVSKVNFINNRTKGKMTVIDQHPQEAAQQPSAQAGNNERSQMASSNEALSTTQYNNNNSNSNKFNEDTLAYIATNQTGIAMTASDQNKVSLNDDSNSQKTIQRNFDYKDTTLVLSQKSGTVEMTKQGKSNKEFKEYNQRHIGAMEPSSERSETLADFNSYSRRLPQSKEGNGEQNEYDQSVQQDGHAGAINTTGNNTPKAMLVEGGQGADQEMMKLVQHGQQSARDGAGSQGEL